MISMISYEILGSRIGVYVISVSQVPLKEDAVKMYDLGLLTQHNSVFA